MHRIIAEELIAGEFIISADVRHHLRVIRRHTAFLCLYKGVYYHCQWEGGRMLAQEATSIYNEYDRPVYLAISYIRPRYLEWMIQKAVELGTHTIYLFNATHAEGVEQHLRPSSRRRYEQIIRGAVTQSGRNHIPEIVHVDSLASLLQLVPAANKFIADERASDQALPISLPTDSLLIIGPEGGFTAEEIRYATDRGCQLVYLGPRILRSETAALTLLAKIIE